MDTLNPTHSLTHLLTHSVTHSLTQSVKVKEGKHQEDNFHDVSFGKEQRYGCIHIELCHRGQKSGNVENQLRRSTQT